MSRSSPPDGTPSPAAPSRQDLSEPARQLSSETLLGGRDEVLIHHEGELYRLRRTRQGKLILTK